MVLQACYSILVFMELFVLHMLKYFLFHGLTAGSLVEYISDELEICHHFLVLKLIS